VGVVTPGSGCERFQGLLAEEAVGPTTPPTGIPSTSRTGGASWAIRTSWASRTSRRTSGAIRRRSAPPCHDRDAAAQRGLAV
jgi:hypothetical protein